MGNIIELNGKEVSPLALTLRAALLSDGSASQDLNGLTVPVDEWRRLARVAARDLGRPVRTFVSSDAIHAVLRDWPADDRESAIHDRAMREAVEASKLATEMTSSISKCPSCGTQREWQAAARVESTGTVKCSSCGLIELQPSAR